MGWRGYIDNTHKTVFFWSQKAACTTLFGFLADNIQPRPEHKGYFHRNSQPYKQCLNAVGKHGYRSVILVRHPVTRAISAYFNKFCVYRNKPLLSRSDLEPFAKELHDTYCARRGIDTQDNIISFESFLDTVAHMHASRPKPNLPINGHWDTQVPPFLAPELQYDTIIHVEALDDELGALARSLGMQWRARTMNRTATKAAVQPDYLGALPAREIATRPFDYGNFITPKTLDKITAIYGVDFEKFGYDLRPDLSPQGG